jgi:hypothetical protein
MEPIDPHDWHVLDAEAGLEVRQTIGPDDANQWEVRSPGRDTVVLDDAEFDRLRAAGPNPRGL